MEFTQLINARYSVRKYDQRPVEEEKLQAILEAGRVAPTARNSQPQRILVIRGKEAYQKLKTCTPFTFDAPVVLLVCYDRAQEAFQSKGDGRGFAAVDASIVMTHMMLAAADQGLGSCWVGIFEPTLVREAFRLPDSYEILSLLPLGYAAEDAEPNPRHSDRRPLCETVFYDSF